MVPTPHRTCVTLLGAGTQGRRLAYMWSSQGRDVHLIDAQSKQLQDSLEYIEKLQSTTSNSGKQHGIIKLHSPDTLADALKDSWLVVECIPEKLSLKRDAIVLLDRDAPSDTIIASNSSSFTIAEIIEGLKLSNYRRVLSAHSYWPPETNAIELMGHRDTDPALISHLIDECRNHGFKPFAVKNDSTGYIYNRIWAAIKREALLVAAENIASPVEVDEIFKDVLKTPKGPFEQMDVVGLDVVLDIEEHYATKRADVPSQPREYLKGFISKGELGVKSGRGFYDYNAD